MKLRAYHGDPAIKEKYLARVRAHREADHLIQGIGWSNGRGCAVGCTLEEYDHHRYPIELEIPGAWAYLEDAIFEGLPEVDAMAWPEAFLSAIREGADLWPAYHRVTARILREIAAPNVPDDEPTESRRRILDAIETVARLYDDAAEGRTTSPTEAYWQAYQATWTEITAESAETEARINAEADAEADARSAANAARNAARGAAMNAARNAAWNAARGAAMNAAWNAALSAARNAARNAAMNAAWNAALSAAMNAAWNAAWNAALSAARNAAMNAAWNAALSAAWKRIRDIALEELHRA